MNVLLSVGCDQYDYLKALKGAEVDARSMFDSLKNGNYYDQDRSKLLLSPSVVEITNELSNSLRGEEISVFTFFFAGHAGGKNGSFYLALKESEAEALSTTAFPLARLFEMVNEFQPKKINIIIDGCDAGSSTDNLNTLLRSENIGTLQSTGVSFLGACAKRQTAKETQEGGLLTAHILSVLSGDSNLKLKKTIIELTDIAAFVSEAVTKEAPDQQPIWWGLDLFGQSGLAKNQTFQIEAPIPSISLKTIDHSSDMRAHMSELSEELWNEYRLASEDFDPRRLSKLLNRLFKPATLKTEDRVTASTGLISSFLPISKLEGELLTQHICVSTFLTSLLPWVENSSVCKLVRQHLELDFHRSNQLLAGLLDEIPTNESRLMSHCGMLSDIYFLPIRVIKLLGFIGTLSLLGDLLNFKTEESKVLHKRLVQLLLSTYSKQLISIDDEQAAPLYIFLKAAQRNGWEEEAKQVVQSMYFDIVMHGGAVNRLNSDGKGALEHLLKISDSGLSSGKYLPANPSSLLAVILIGGHWFKCSEAWDLKAFDRRVVGLYLPSNFNDFSEQVIQHGCTHTWRIGFGIWHVEELVSEFEKVISNSRDDVSLIPESHALCMLAAMLFPDRVPLNLEFLSA